MSSLFSPLFLTTLNKINIADEDAEKERESKKRSMTASKHLLN